MRGACAECRWDSHGTCQQWIDLPEEGCCCGAMRLDPDEVQE